VLSDDVEVPEGLAWMLEAVERTRAVARQLVGLNLHEANELAARSRCQLREVRRDGKGSVITADWRSNRINIETENGVVVETSVG
jgi:hypothetical protein